MPPSACLVDRQREDAVVSLIIKAGVSAGLKETELDNNNKEQDVDVTKDYDNNNDDDIDDSGEKNGETQRLRIPSTPSLGQV